VVQQAAELIHSLFVLYLAACWKVKSLDGQLPDTIWVLFDKEKGQDPNERKLVWEMTVAPPTFG